MAVSLLALATAVGAAAWAGSRMIEPPAPATVAGADGVAAPDGAAPGDGDVALASDRPVYPYSVIPGGAYSADELEDAVLRDPVVAGAYGDVTPASFRATPVAADRLAYMSYRLNDRIYWTKKAIHLHRGETILTDGDRQIRARCGNGISLDPMLPTSDNEPAGLDLQPLAAPVEPLGPIASRQLFGYEGVSGGSSNPFYEAIGGSLGNLPNGAGGLFPSRGGNDLVEELFPPDLGLPPTPPPGGGTPGTTPPVEFIPGNPPTIVIPGGLPPTGDDPKNPFPPDDPLVPPTTPDTPVPTPEPGTVLLLLTGGGMLAMRRLRDRRASTRD
jgi:hypothetical protein